MNKYRKKTNFELYGNEARKKNFNYRQCNLKFGFL